MMAQAYDDYQQSVQSGWTVTQAMEHACHCWGVSAEDLAAYISVFA
jgi:hypothetical protein